MKKHFLGLRTLMFPAKDLQKTKEWYIQALGFQPYFDQPFYVGFNVGGFELGLDPNAPEGKSGGAQTYWGVEDIEATLAHLISLGASEENKIEDVGDGIKVATVLDPFGNQIGLIQNPHFSLEA